MTDSRDPASLAGDLFSDWLARRESGETEPFKNLVSAHPECADVLRAMHANWERIEALRKTDTDKEPSLAERLRERFGSGVDPEVSLDGDATRAESRASSSAESKLYDDLQKRGPSSGRYRLEGELAQGGMGAILRVYDKDLRRNLAMKVMLEEKEGRLSRFLEEAQVTGQLDHPGIVPVHELGIDAKGKVFFTMKLVKGRDLREIFEQVHAGDPDWSVTRAVDVLKRVCEAMAFAHEKNVIHRDLKPGNIMVGRHGEVYVMDWGLAKVLGRKETKDVRIAPASQSVVNTERRQVGSETPDSPLLTMDGDAIGTPSYMPIEQAEGNLEALGPRTDIYAIGAMLYHLLAGHAPYVDPDEDAGGRVILKRVLAGPPEPIRSLAKSAPIELIAICEKAMARKAANRYTSMTELGDDLRAYLERRVVKAYRTGMIAETKMWVARNRALAAAIVVGFVLLGAFGWQQRIAAKQAVDLADQQRIANEKDRERAAERDRVLQLADVKELRDLQVRGKTLLEDRAAVYRSYSKYDSLIVSMKKWIVGAEAVSARLPQHEATLVSLESRGRRASETDPWLFDSREDEWWHSAVSELVPGFRSLTSDDPALISTRAIRDRIAEFETIYANSIGEHRAEWDACIASIADPTECPAYLGLKIVPQVGLLPIGRDLQSGLWEFWFVDATGRKPERGSDGKLILTDDFGLVFVLLPGGKFWMGAQKEDPNGQNYDPYASGDEGPVHQVTLAPYFLSKYEMTEHQWILRSGDEAWRYGTRNSRMPVDSISWEDAKAVLPMLHLHLPSEAQWEYACRAETSTPWSTGTEKSSLLGLANLKDKDVVDGIERVERVGKLGPNPFGMHDMHGNSREWCLDGYYADASYQKPIDPKSGEHLFDGALFRFRVYRGGGYWDGAEDARSAFRRGFDPVARNTSIGVRPRRVITD